MLQLGFLVIIIVVVVIMRVELDMAIHACVARSDHVFRVGLVVWLSGNALVVINEVTLRQARLILGWVTVCGQVNHLGM